MNWLPDPIESMNGRARALARRLGKLSRDGNEAVDAEVILDEDHAISVCLDGGFLLVENLDLPAEQDVNVLQFETERELLGFLGEDGVHCN